MLEPKKASLSEPAFLIQANGKIYLTLGVLEYDPSATTDSNKLAVINQMQQQIQNGPQIPAVQLASGSGTSFANTNANTRPPNSSDPIL